MRGTYLGADGRYADTLSMKIWNIGQRPFIPVDADGYGRVEPRAMYPQMEGQAVFKNAVERLLVVVGESLEKHDLAASDVDLFCFHQANLRINDYVRDPCACPPRR